MDVGDQVERKILSVVFCAADVPNRESLLYRRLMSARLKLSDEFEIHHHSGRVDAEVIAEWSAKVNSRYVVFVHEDHIASHNFVSTALAYLRSRTVFLAEPQMFNSAIPAIKEYKRSNSGDYVRSTDVFGVVFNTDRLRDFIDIVPDLDRVAIYIGYRLYWQIGSVAPLSTGYSVLSVSHLTNGIQLTGSALRLLPVMSTSSLPIRIFALHLVVLALKGVRREGRTHVTLAHIRDLIRTLNLVSLLSIAESRDPLEAAFIRWIADRSIKSELYKRLGDVDFHLKFSSGTSLEGEDVPLYDLQFGDECVAVAKSYVESPGESAGLDSVDWYAGGVTPESTILMFDRTTGADDNAEYFYRWMRSEHPEFENMYFALSRKSPDWERLELDGFKLVEFWSPEFVDVFVDSAVVVSSQIYNFSRGGKSMKDSRVVYLQHGIQLNDMRDWVVTKHYDVFIATGRDEAEYLSEVAPREVLNSGIPRLQSLAERTDEKDTLLFMPTWRYGLNQVSAEGFQRSTFFRRLDALLTDANLRDYLAASDKILKVKLHPNLAQWAHLFHFSDRVQLTDESYQDALASAEFAFTDYSSVVLDAAFVGTPIAYYQWDHAEFFADQPYSSRVDFGTEGLGPVFIDGEGLIEHIISGAYANQDPEFEQRRAKFFAGVEADRINETIFRRMVEL